MLELDGLGRPPRELFTESPLALILEADFDRLSKDRSQESEERPARMVLAGSDGSPVTTTLTVRTRGNFRLQRRICPFPPIRLNLSEGRLAGTVLDGQDKLKVVAHCRDQDSYEQNVLEEYLAYRIYNLLTDVSFRVQLARITYVHANGRKGPFSRAAFLIEDEEAMAARLDGTMIEVSSAPADEFKPEQAGLMYLFQYMIGNVDWSMVTFHNVKAMRIGREYFPIPYDFDFSGLVNAPYAGPNPQVADEIRSVRERLFRGICSDRIDYGALFAHVIERREAILDLIRGQSGLTERNIDSAVDYVEEFYDVINNPRRARREILEACRR